MPADTCYDFPLLKDEVSAIVQDAVLSVLEGNAYDNAKVSVEVSNSLVTYLHTADFQVIDV